MTVVVLVLAAGAGVSAAGASAAVGGGSRQLAPFDDTSERRLPMDTIVLPDGTIQQELKPEVLRELKTAAAVAAAGCGRTCDWKNPQTYLITPPGGQSNWYRCADDAVTVKAAYLPGGGSHGVQLRYSPRCRTAWARELDLPEWYALILHSYYPSGTRRTVSYANEHNPYTVMFDDAGLLAKALLAKACAEYSNSAEGNGVHLICTTKY